MEDKTEIYIALLVILGVLIVGVYLMGEMIRFVIEWIGRLSLPGLQFSF
jgi:hypothetical protein